MTTMQEHDFKLVCMFLSCVFPRMLKAFLMVTGSPLLSLNFTLWKTVALFHLSCQGVTR